MSHLDGAEVLGTLDTGKCPARFDALAHRANGEPALIAVFVVDDRSPEGVRKVMRQATWGEFVYDALCGPYKHNYELPPDKSRLHALLGRKVQQAGEIRLRPQNVVLILEATAKVLPPDIRQSILELLDAKEAGKSAEAEDDL